MLGSLLFLQTSNVNAHEDLDIGHNKHDPITCKSEAERTYMERFFCRHKREKHQLCKLDQYCAILRLDKLDEEKHIWEFPPPE